MTKRDCLELKSELFLLNFVFGNEHFTFTRYWPPAVANLELCVLVSPTGSSVTVVGIQFHKIHFPHLFHYIIQCKAGHGHLPTFRSLCATNELMVSLIYNLKIISTNCLTNKVLCYKAAIIDIDSYFWVRLRHKINYVQLRRNYVNEK